MANTQTRPFDASDYLNGEDDMVAYLHAALEEDDLSVFTAALGDVARAKGMSWVARGAGMGRESLYKALSPDGNPEFATIVKVLRAMGLSLHVERAKSVGSSCDRAAYDAVLGKVRDEAPLPGDEL